MITIKYEDLELAFEFVSSSQFEDNAAYVSLDTGRFYWLSDTDPVEEEEVPEDLDLSDRYIAVPHKNDLDLGRNLALRFAAERLPGRYDDIAACFRGRGAYARFKDLLAAEGCLDAWYAYKAEATRRALMDWCEENDIGVTTPQR